MGKAHKRISTNYLFVPTMSLFFIFFTGLSFLLIQIRLVGKKLIQSSNEYIYYSDAAREFQFGSDELTKYARLFVSTGNRKYLDDYYYEDKHSRHRDNALEMLRDNQDYEFSYIQLVKAHTLSLNLMMIEIRAMAMRAACSDINYSLEEYPELFSHALYYKEMNLSDLELQNTARDILMNEEYFAAKDAIYDAVNNSISDILARSRWYFLRYTERSKLIVKYESICVTIILILFLTAFITISRFLISPLVHCTKEVKAEKPITIHAGFAEIKYLQKAYNDLLEHRVILENTLRRTSQTDALTGLPNRLAFQNYMSQMCNRDSDISFAILSFDVNGLKTTNDNFGHIAGDTLIRNAAACIASIFADKQEENCFRTGGDEFVSCVLGKTEEDIKKMITKFYEVQKTYNTKIAAGYAFSPSVKIISPENLFQTADEMMYKVKAEMKKNTPDSTVRR